MIWELDETFSTRIYHSYKEHIDIIHTGRQNLHAELDQQRLLRVRRLLSDADSTTRAKLIEALDEALQLRVRRAAVADLLERDARHFGDERCVVRVHRLPEGEEYITAT